MQFLRAAILTIAALAFTASASAVDSSASCASERCYSDKDCGSCYCADGQPGVVSSLLLLARSELTSNHLTEVWILPNSSMVKESDLKWNED